MSLIKFSNLLSLTVEESLFIPEPYIKSLNFFLFLHNFFVALMRISKFFLTWYLPTLKKIKSETLI